MFKPRGKTKLKWSPGFAYAIGLIASDGTLNKDGRHIYIKSADKELIENFKKALNTKNKIGRVNERVKRTHFYLNLSDTLFYKFLNQIGLQPTKSKTIQSVEIPEKYFSDFLRGLFDGDGSFYSYYDKRWPKSFGFKLSFASASPNFISWLKEKLTELYNVKGYFHKGDGVMNLEYTKGDSKKLFYAMYYSRNILFLKRKYFKIKAAIKKDETLGLEHLQKPRAGVA